MGERTDAELWKIYNAARGDGSGHSRRALYNAGAEDGAARERARVLNGVLDVRRKVEVAAREADQSEVGCWGAALSTLDMILVAIETGAEEPAGAGWEGPNHE